MDFISIAVYLFFHHILHQKYFTWYGQPSNFHEPIVLLHILYTNSCVQKCICKPLCEFIFSVVIPPDKVDEMYPKRKYKLLIVCTNHNIFFNYCRFTLWCKSMLKVQMYFLHVKLIYRVHYLVFTMKDLNSVRCESRPTYATYGSLSNCFEKCCDVDHYLLLLQDKHIKQL